MNFKELKELVANGESSTLEFKRKISSNQKIAKEITAFANTLGGTLLIGVDDDKAIIGVDSEKEVVDAIILTCQFFIIPAIEPQIDIININKKNLDVIAVFISKGKVRPYRCIENPDDKNSEKTVYIRVGENSLIASREMSKLLSYQNEDSPPLSISISDREKRLFSYLDNYQRITVKEFAKLVNIAPRRAQNILIKLVRAGIVQIHIDTSHDFFTLV